MPDKIMEGDDNIYRIQQQDPFGRNFSTEEGSLLSSLPRPLLIEAIAETIKSLPDEDRNRMLRPINRKLVSNIGGNNLPSKLNLELQNYALGIKVENVPFVEGADYEYKYIVSGYVDALRSTKDTNSELSEKIKSLLKKNMEDISRGNPDSDKLLKFVDLVNNKI